MTSLTLILPGLLWPPHSARQATHDLHLTSLPWLLGAAKPERCAPASAEEHLLACFGLDPKTGGLAALRALGDGLDEKHLLCADPVSLHVQHEGLMLGDVDTLNLTADEAHALTNSLNSSFPDVGRFIAAAPDRWYLALHRPLPAGTRPLFDVIGRRVDNFLPQDASMRRLMNEIQMLLHAHPVNQARERNGQMPVNSLWLWGEGALPQHPPRALHVDAEGPLARGLQRWAQARADAPTVRVLSSLWRPWLSGDLDAWREALIELDQHSLTPARQALKKGELTLTLMLPGDRFSLRLTCTRPPWWRLRPRRGDLQHLLTEHSPS
jgi:hypothetical protein